MNASSIFSKAASILLFSTLFFGVRTLYAQNIAINGTGNNPDPSAMLDVQASDKGLLIPRVGLNDTATQAPIAVAPAEGLMIYNQTGSEPKGYYYWDAGKGQWIQVGRGAADNDWTRDAADGELFPSTLTDFVGIGINAPGYRLETSGNGGFAVGAFYNANSGGTGLVGTGSGAGTYYTLVDGAGISGAGNNVGTVGWGLEDTSSGVYGSNNVEGTFGYVGSPNWGVYGDDGSGNAGALGGPTWSGYFWGDAVIQTQAGNANVVFDEQGFNEPGIHPNADGWGLVGTNALAWWEMHSYGFTNVSLRSKKEAVHSLASSSNYAYLMKDIEEMELAFYKYKGRNNDEQNFRLGTFIDASPAYIQDASYSGVNLYDYTSLAMAGVKHLNERVKALEEHELASKDMGNVKGAGKERIRVTYSKAFSKAVRKYGHPVLDLTAIGGNADLYVASRDKKGFTIGVEDPPEKTWTIDWTAELDLPQEKMSPQPPEGLEGKLKVSEQEKKAARERRTKGTEKYREPRRELEQKGAQEKAGGKKESQGKKR